MRTFHLPMPEHLHELLRTEATAADRPASELVREALVGWLAERRRKRLADEIEAFAVREAGGAMDLDAELEAAGIAHMTADDGA